MTLDEEEYKKLLAEIVTTAKKSGIGSDQMTSILAEAIANREKALQSEAQIKQAESSVQEHTLPQLVYGPPPIKKEEEVQTYTPPQLIYGPPPFREEVEVREYAPPQPIYGPPPFREEEVIVSPIQLLYGPPPVNPSKVTPGDVPKKR